MTHVPDILENRCPRCHTDTSTDQNSDFVLEHILSRSSVWTIDAELGHLLAVTERNLIHAHGVQVVVELRLGLTSAERICESTGKVTNLADMHGNVGIKWAGSDGERMPLVLRNARHVEEEPLASLVLERRLAELDLKSIYGYY